MSLMTKHRSQWFLGQASQECFNFLPIKLCTIPLSLRISSFQQPSPPWLSTIYIISNYQSLHEKVTDAQTSSPQCKEGMSIQV